MMQVIQMTDKEKLKMYMKCSKKELAKMLIECNHLIAANIHTTIQTPTISGKQIIDTFTDLN